MSRGKIVTYFTNPWNRLNIFPKVSKVNLDSICEKCVAHCLAQKHSQMFVFSLKKSGVLLAEEKMKEILLCQLPVISELKDYVL